MDRREFLKTAVAAPVAGAVPVIVDPKSTVYMPLSLEAIQRARNNLMDAALLRHDYMVFVHGQMARDLADMKRREQWANAYRDWRKAGKPGGDAGLQQVMIDVRDNGGWAQSPKPMQGEIGVFDGMRIIKSTWNQGPDGSARLTERVIPWQEFYK